MVIQTMLVKANEVKNYYAQETLRDGRLLRIRAIKPDDKPVMQEVMEHLSPQSRYFRFFIPKDSLSERELERFTEIDFCHHVGLLASVGDGDKFVPAGTGRYITCMKDGEFADDAELSFAVEEEFQGIGIGTLLLKHLVGIARQSNLKYFVAYVLADNQKMLDVFAGCGLPMTQSVGANGVIEVKLEIPEQ